MMVLDIYHDDEHDDHDDDDEHDDYYVISMMMTHVMVILWMCLMTVMSCTFTGCEADDCISVSKRSGASS